MVEVYDLEERSISEILLLVANPPGLEERLVPEGTSIESHLQDEEADMLYDIIRDKLTHTLNQRRAILKVIDEVAFRNHHPNPESGAAFSNEAELIDHIVENLWGKVYRQVEGMERRYRKSLGEKVDNLWKRSTTLRRARDWSNPKKLPGFKSHERKREVSVSLEHYEGGGAKIPLIRQKAGKLPYSVGDKFRRELEKAFAGEKSLGSIPGEIRDFVKAMIVTLYGGHDTGPFANPNIDSSAQTDLHRNIKVALQDPRLVEVKSDNYYHDEKSDINLIRSYVKLSDDFLSHTGEEIVRYPPVFSGKDQVSFVAVDARNYFAYFFGKGSHARSKMHGHKGSVHKDSEELDLSRKEKKIAKECGERVKRTYQHATVMRSSG